MNPISLTVAPKEISFANDKKATLEHTVVISNLSPCTAVWGIRCTDTKSITPIPVKGFLKEGEKADVIIQFKCEGNKEKVKHDYITINAYEPGAESEKQRITKVKIKYHSDESKPAEPEPKPDAEAKPVEKDETE